MFRSDGSLHSAVIAEQLNCIERKISKYKNDRKSLILYVGDQQYYAMSQIAIGDPNEFRNQRFLGVLVIRIAQESYLHLTIPEYATHIPELAKNILRQIKTARELTMDSNILAVLCQIEGLAQQIEYDSN